jgi:hypothetical protein
MAGFVDGKASEASLLQLQGQGSSDELVLNRA